MRGGFHSGRGSTYIAPPTGGGGGEPVFNAATQTMVYQDNMDAYTTPAAMGSAALNGSGARIVPQNSPANDGTPIVPAWYDVITGRSGSGKALRMINSGDDQTGSTFVTLEIPDTPLNSVHYFQYWAKATFDTPLTNSDTLSQKWFMLWWKNDSGERLQFTPHSHLPWSKPGGSYLKTTYFQVSDHSRETAGQGIQPIGPYFNDDIQGLWTRFTAKVKPNTSLGSRDCDIGLWINGTRVINISPAVVGITPPGGEKTWCEVDDLDMIEDHDTIRQIYWGDVQTLPSVTGRWTLDIDDFFWWRDS